MEQLSIFDVFNFAAPAADIQALPESDMIRIISENTGIVFHKNGYAPEENYTWYESKKGKSCISVHYSHYFEDNRRFIAVDVLSDNEGAGSPTDSIEEAIQKVRQYARRYGWNN